MATLAPPDRAPRLDVDRARGGPVSCDHAAVCSGCPLIGLAYPAQLERKRDRVARALERYPALRTIPVLPIVPASPFVEYRTRAKLMVGPRGELGLFAQGDRAHAVIDIPGCRVLSPAIARVAAYLRARVREATSGDAGSPLRPLDPTRPSGSLRAVDLREVVNAGAPAILVTLVVAKACDAELRAVARDIMAALPEVAGVAASVHAGESPQVLGSEIHPLAGALSVPDRIGGAVHAATFGSFVQAHRGQAEWIHMLLVEALGLERASATGEAHSSSAQPRTARVLDLYGGSGAIALGLAAAGASVRVIESFAPAAAAAGDAAREQGLDVVAEHSDVGAALDRLARTHERFDAAVVNPPRRGTSPETRAQLARVGPARIAYVSCDPDTLARDLEHLSRLGYRAESVRPVDMIPLSDHVEAVALLHRAPPALPVTLGRATADLGRGAIALEKAPHEPTVPQGEYPSSLLTRARLLPAAAHAVPVYRLDVGASGVVLFALQLADLERWTGLLRAPGARRVYLAAVRGVTAAAGVIRRELDPGKKKRPAETRFERLAVCAGHCLLRLDVAAAEEGRHQVRRHLASLGHPLLGDERYGHTPTNRHFSEKYGLDRVFLHCTRLEIPAPDGAPWNIDSSLAPDLAAVLERLGGPATF